MKLYLVRHAEAIERSGTMPDAVRYLTPKGRPAFRKVARRVRKAGIAPDRVSIAEKHPAIARIGFAMARVHSFATSRRTPLRGAELPGC
jgi:phosphohistidine phosphatase